MRVLLRRRAERATEVMDDPRCDLERLRSTYARFALVNRLVSGWRATYATCLRPLMRLGERFTLLDVGFGGGDVPARIAGWARRDGLDLAVTAVDPDPRALGFVRDRPHVPGVHYRCASAADLLREGASFDFVVSNHVLHHLATAELDGFCRETAALARRRVVHSDLERDDVAFLLYAVLSLPLSPGSYLREDGLASIRRAFTGPELARRAPPGWRSERLRPFRLLLLHDA